MYNRIASTSRRFTAALLLAVAGTFMLGTNFALAFTCTETGCRDYAEGYCAWHGGLDDSDFDNPTCTITCQTESTTADCEDV
jgi:hypothetical protein